MTNYYYGSDSSSEASVAAGNENDASFENDENAVDTTLTTTTVKKIYIQPVFNGSIMLTVGRHLQFKTGFKVVCTAASSPSNYFEALIHSYDSATGELNLHKLQSINGKFSSTSNYHVSVVSGYQEIDRMKDKLERLYLEVFNINIGTEDTSSLPYGSLGANVLIHQLSLYYQYFFNEYITNDNDYELTEGYITKKVNFLYEYFFNSTSRVLNINDNNVVLDNLTDKVIQLNVYFFDTADLVEDMMNENNHSHSTHHHHHNCCCD